MKGADKYCEVFKKAEQIGRLYILPSSRVHGDTFRIYVLPENVDAIKNGRHNPPANRDTVEVYGVICGQQGWSEEYGWLHIGKWIEDFEAIYEERKEAIAQHEQEAIKRVEEHNRNNEKRISNLLFNYEKSNF